MDIKLTRSPRGACGLLTGLLGAWAGWAVLTAAGLFVMVPPGEAARIAADLGTTVPGYPLATLALLSVTLGLGITVIMAACGAVFGTTVAAMRTITAAVNGSPRTPVTDIATIVSAVVLLGGMIALYGVLIPLFVVWEALLLIGILAGAWRLAHSGDDPFFDGEAIAVLRQAAERAKPLGLAVLVCLAGILGWSFRIAAMPPPWPATLAVAASGVLVGLALPVERDVRQAIVIARHNRTVRRIRNGERRS